MQPNTIAFESTPECAEEQILRELNAALGDQAFRHWFDQKVSLTIEGDELTLGVASPFMVDWFVKQFRESAHQAVQSVLGPSSRVRFAVDAEIARRQLQAGDEERKPARPQAPTASQQSSKRRQRRPARRYADLREFIEGPCNDMALTAAWQVCNSSDSRFNPLFVHGPVGTGKTHLLEGIYRHIRTEHPQWQAVLLSAESFANYFTGALKDHSLPSFRQRFRTVDLLLVDDVDFFGGKRVIQEEFLNTFKQLTDNGGQVILSGNQHPRLLTKFSDELKSRLLSGMVCRLDAPDAETRRAIVHHKSRRLPGSFSQEALDFVADRFRNNVRELEGALHCLQTYYSMTGRRVALTAAQRVLTDLERDCIRVIRMADVEQAVCTMFGIDADQLRSSNRGRSVSQPRMLAMYLTRKHTRAAYSEIGGYFGGRKHSTVISAEKKIAGWVQRAETIQVASQTWPVRDVLEALEQQLQVG